MSAIDALKRKQKRDNAWIAALAIVGAVVIILFAIAFWAFLILGLAWGIWSVVTSGPTFWNIAAIVACGVAILSDIFRRVRK